MSARLGEMTTVEAAAAVLTRTVVLLPVGAFEQHGPGLPLATDQIRAEAVCERVAASLPHDVVIGPSLPVGVSPHHLGFAGTVTLRPATFVAILREYVDSLAASGWRRFLVVTGHGGNNAALGTLVQELLQDRPDVELAWTPLTALAPGVVDDMDVSEVHGHSGEAETAQMLHVAPDLVRRELLEAGTTRLEELDGTARLSRRPGQPTIAVRYDRLSPIGVLGDPRRADAEQGRAIIDTITTHVVDFIEEWIAI